MGEYDKAMAGCDVLIHTAARVASVEEVNTMSEAEADDGVQTRFEIKLSMKKYSNVMGGLS